MVSSPILLRSLSKKDVMASHPPKTFITGDVLKITPAFTFLKKEIYEDKEKKKIKLTSCFSVQKSKLDKNQTEVIEDEEQSIGKK